MSFAAEGVDSSLSVFWPCSNVWGMGFAWSSFVAQESLLEVCRRAGLGAKQALAPDNDVPESTALMFSLATDDVMIFSSAGEGGTTAPTLRVEAEMLAAGIAKHPAKDEDDVLNAVCVGVELIDGLYWWPPAERMWLLMRTIVWLCEQRRGSPAGVLALLGVLQWFDLMRRPKLSCYHAVYSFTADWHDWGVRDLPRAVRSELLTSVLLSPFWGIDMSLRFLPFIAATDASDEFGIGACVTDASDDYIRSLSRHVEKNGTYVTIEDIQPKARARSLGDPILIEKKLGDFTSIFSVRCDDGEHINLREARAVVHFLKWLLRSSSRHRGKVILLVDSRVVVGAACKGRSGSQPLNVFLKRIAALSFAGGILLQIVYIPTEFNPADYPSRGLRVPGRRRAPVLLPRCPACRLRPHEHPAHVPRRLRGTGLPCRCPLAHAFVDGGWKLWIDLRVQDWINSCPKDTADLEMMRGTALLDHLDWSSLKPATH